MGIVRDDAWLACRLRNLRDAYSGLKGGVKELEWSNVVTHADGVIRDAMAIRRYAQDRCDELGDQ